MTKATYDKIAAGLNDVRLRVTQQTHCIMCNEPSFYALCEPCAALADVRRRDREILKRLAELKTADMPWLTPEGLASLKDAPEQSGPREYVKPKGWK